MYPKICQVGPFPIYSYGLMLAIAVVVCSFLMSRDARRLNIASENIFDWVFWIVLCGILGARVMYIILHWEFFQGQFIEVFMLQNGGLSWQGGLTAGLVTAIWYIKKKKLPVLPMLDLIAPYLALGQSIGRIGCFLNGCCYGREVAWGIYFPVHDAHLHPTQLYMSGGLLVIFFLLKAFQRRAQVPGYVFALYLTLASCQRFVIEFFRGDHYYTYGGLSIYQLVAFFGFCLGITLFIYSFKLWKKRS